MVSGLPAVAMLKGNNGLKTDVIIRIEKYKKSNKEVRRSEKL